MDKSKIEWTDATWNPIRGCSIVSAGCTNCYAMRQAHRFSGAGGHYEGLTRMTRGGPVWTGEVRPIPEVLDAPLRWVRPRRVFVNSMSDLFHEAIPFEFIASVFAIMAVTSRHAYQVLTKRPERMIEFFRWVLDDGEGGTLRASDFDAGTRIESHWPEHVPWVASHRGKRGGYDNCGPAFPYSNIWLGVSVEDQATAEERIPLLLQTPAAVRFVSYEPALGPVNFAHIETRDYRSPLGTWCNALAGTFTGSPRLDWVICGGESGPKARPFDIAWARSTIAQCKAAGVPCFVKQLGARPVALRDTLDTVGYRMPLNDRAGGDPSEWPEDLRVRQWPLVESTEPEEQ